LHGLLFTSGGSVGITEFYAGRFIELLGSLPEPSAVLLIGDLIDAASSATWIGYWRNTNTPVNPAEVILALKDEAIRLPETHQDPATRLWSALLPEVVV